MNSFQNEEQQNILRFISLLGQDLRACSTGLDRLAIAEIGDAIHNLHSVSYGDFLTIYLRPLIAFFENRAGNLMSIDFAQTLLVNHTGEKMH